METKLNQEESLRIVNEMIAEARSSFNSDSSKSMVLMGYSVAIIALLNIVLLYLLPCQGNSFYVWLLMVPVSVTDSLMSCKRKQVAVVSTHLEKIVHSVWSAYSYSIIVLLIMVFAWSYFTDNWVFTQVIMPSILLLTGLAQYVTGVTCRFKPYKYAAYLFWGAAVACVLLGFTPYYAVSQFVILAVCMLLGFVLPSLKLNKIGNQNV